MSRVMGYISQFFNDIATVPRLAIALSILFGVVVLGLFVINLFFGAMAKVRKSCAKTKKFIKKQDYIDYFNVKSYYKKCVAILPKKARKAWKSFEVSNKPIQNTHFELSLRESVARGGAIGFGVYLYLYIAVMALLVVAMMVSNLPQEISSIYVCVCLIIGAVGLFILGMQLYIMDKKAVSRLDYLVATIYSKSKINKIVPAPSTSAVSYSAPKTAPTVLAENKPVYSNLDRINSANNLETKVSDGADCIDKLNVLVDEIVKKGENAELIACVQKALLAVYDIKFTKPIDELRLKCIIKKLDSCHSA